jgi:hypothetical protein
VMAVLAAGVNGQPGASDEHARQAAFVFRGTVGRVGASNARSVGSVERARPPFSRTRPTEERPAGR